MLTDPIADMLTRIRNAHLALHKEVNVPRSKMKEALAAILKQEGYVEDVAIDDRNITITLKYQKGKAVISGLKRVSTPGRRVYVGAHQIPKVQNGLGICILSTSSGVLDGMTAHERRWAANFCVKSGRGAPCLVSANSPLPFPLALKSRSERMLWK